MGRVATSGVQLPKASTVTALCVTFTLLLTLTWAQDQCQLLVVRENIVYLHGDFTCQKLVTLNKCEGQCESNVTPSVREHQGFRKTCKCCKELMTRQENEILTECYDQDNLRVEGMSVSVAVTKIISCSCTECTN